jgi:ABC-type nitrate/sulfonate/bicarbonate transport system permease component
MYSGRKFAQLAPPSITLVALLLVCEVLPRLDLVNPRRFPPTSLVLGALTHEIYTGRLFSPLAQTFSTWIVALSISCAIALAVGLVVALSDAAKCLATPVIEFIRPIPSTALIPLVVLSLGTNFASALVLVCLGTTTQMLPSIIGGLSQVEAVSQDTARAFNFTWAQQLRWLVLPSMMPFFWTAVRHATAASLVLLIAMELLAGIHGIGHEIAMAYAGANAPVMYAYIFLTGLCGGTINMILSHSLGKEHKKQNS